MYFQSMKRTSYLAQTSFNLVQRLHFFSARSNGPVGFLARALNKVAAKPIARRFGENRTVIATAYGRSLQMPAEHLLPTNLKYFPQYNRPLAQAVAVLAEHNPVGGVAVIDVGANIGDTVAILDQRLPGACWYLCIEPDPDLARLCRSNHIDNPRLQIEHCFIGEQEGLSVRLEDDGRANPSTKVLTSERRDGEGTHGKLRRLDTVAAAFGEERGTIGLIKTDTEGYDFSVLRSGEKLLAKYKPSLYFEWYPRLLHELDQTEWQGFEDLARLGYHHFAFFNELGDFYCKVSHPDRLFLRSLAAVVLRPGPTSYFDVFASTDQSICDRLVELSTSESLS